MTLLFRAPYFKSGIENIVEQSLRGKLNNEFIPVINEEIFSFMGCDKKKTEEVDESKSGDTNKAPMEQQTEDRSFKFIGSDFLPQVPESLPPAPPPPPLEPPPPPPEEESLLPQPETNGSCPGSLDVRVQINEFSLKPNINGDDNAMGATIMHEGTDSTQAQINGWNHEEEEQDDEPMETCPYEDDEFVEDDESEEESPMFEKIGEVSPPRPVLLEDSETILRELQEEANRNSQAKAISNEQELLKPSAVVFESECKFLEPPPLMKEKLAYYKKLPKCKLNK